MKKLISFTIAVLLFISSWSQLCTTTTIEFGEIDPNTGYYNVSVLEIDSSGTLWFNLKSSFGGRGFGKYSDSDTVMFYTGTDLVTLLDPRVYAIAFDKNDSVWIGTHKGLAQFDGISETGWKIFNQSNSSIPFDYISAILIDDNNVKWIGCGNTLATFKDGIWTTVKQFSGDIFDIEVDNQGGIWIAKGGTPGLTRYYNDSWTDFNEFTQIDFIAVDHLNRILVSARDSLVVLSNQEIVEIIKVRPDWQVDLGDIAIGSDNAIWVSTEEGLLLKSGENFHRYDTATSPVLDLVGQVPLVMDTIGNLWYPFMYQQDDKKYPGISKLFQSNEAVIPISAVNESIFDGITQDPVSNWPVVYFCDGDSVELEATENANTYVWKDGVSTERTFYAKSSDTISLAYEGTDGCYYYDTVKSVSKNVFEDEEICLVTVDPVSGFNLIVWERTPDKGISEYVIYRETSTLDVYDTVGSVQFALPSSFIDSLSDPTMQSYKYKISVIDNCDNKSELSSPHATMHLTLSQNLDGGINLIWSKYEGFEVQTYNIWRGSDTSGMSIIGSVSGSNFTFTDHDPITGTNIYKIEVVSPNSCNPDNFKTSYNSSFSNIVDIILEGLEDYHSGKLNIFPNPTKNEITLTIQNQGSDLYQITLIDAYGRIITKMTESIMDEFVLDCSNLTSGIYFIELRGSKLYKGKILIE